MTKEQRLRYEYYKYYRPDFPTDKRTREVVDMAFTIKEEIAAIYKAMDEYAKQQAIDYCSWYNSIGFLPKVKNMEKPGEIFMKDHEELYKEFIEQQTKEK